MRFYFALCAFCVLVLIAGCAKKYDSISKYKETGWEILSSNVNTTLNYIKFYNNNAWIVGENKTVLKSNDGGKNWSLVSMGSDMGTLVDNYNTICFTDANNGFIGGTNGTLLRTTDGGNSWKRFVLSDSTIDTVSKSIAIDSFMINSIVFIDQNKGIALASENNYYYTTNGGNVWTRSTLKKFGVLRDDVGLFNVNFYKGDTVMVSGWMGSIICFYPFRKDPPPTVLATNTLNPLYSLWFLDKDNVIAAGWYGTLLNSSDGGNTWKANTSIPTNVWISSLWFLDNKTEGWLSAKDGFVYHTTDGGKTWENIYTAVPQWLHSIYFVNSNEGWAVGENGIILHTTTGGKK